jgi:hypothetical protein
MEASPDENRKASESASPGITSFKSILRRPGFQHIRENEAVIVGLNPVPRRRICPAIVDEILCVFARQGCRSRISARIIGVSR